MNDGLLRRDINNVAEIVLRKRRADVLEKIRPGMSPNSDYYANLKQTRKKFFGHYVEMLLDSLVSGDTTDFLGNETYEAYSQAKYGFRMDEIVRIPTAVKAAVKEVLEEAVSSNDVDAHQAFKFNVVVDELLDQAQLIRVQAFNQTREEIIKSYHELQEEIDGFPSNLAATFDFQTLMKSAVKKAIELLGVQRCAFFTRDLMSNDLHLKASNFDDDSVFGSAPVRFDDNIMKELVYDQKPVLIKGPMRSCKIISSYMKKMRARCLLLVPLRVRDRNLGIMLLESGEETCIDSSELIELATRFANKVAAAMENARLHGSEQQKLKETMALLEVARLVTSTLDVDLMLSHVAQITLDVCEVLKCSVFLYLSENERFFPSATASKLQGNEWETLFGEGISVSDLREEDVRTLMASKKVVVSNPESSPFYPGEGFENIGVKSVVLVPVCSRDRLLGIIVLYSEEEPDEIEEDELNLVSAIAGQAAVALDNASLYEDLEMSYFSTVKALAKAIEVKDPYTHGHSERVTEYALAIAKRLGVSEWERRNLKYAAALHDIGKIGIARTILNKPGSLSEEEFAHVKTHPQLGDSIIEPVGFLEEPRNIILHHHERYDGKGYPDGLKGEEIPLGARILAVADSFEAMMSDRPYRKALSIEDAVKEIENNAGGQFDPLVVRAFIEVVREGKFDNLIASSKAEQSIE
ncbi:MAG: GAF domain-containing protein [Actinomycetota bacterium]|nr:GAF domain-containing protein [Actinomycetota bacterium]